MIFISFYLSYKFHQTNNVLFHESSSPLRGEHGRVASAMACWTCCERVYETAVCGAASLPANLRTTRPGVLPVCYTKRSHESVPVVSPLGNR